MIVSGVRFVVHEGQFWLKDRDERFVALSTGETGRLKGLAVTGGRELQVSLWWENAGGECCHYGWMINITR